MTWLKRLMVLFMFVATISPASVAVAEVDGQIKSKIQLKEPPIDMKLSRDGQWFYILTASGNLLVYSATGNFNGKVAVGKGFEKIEPGLSEDNIYLLNRKDNTIQIVDLTYTMKIDISQSPWKGAEDAPVVIVEYTDFQCPYCARLGSTLDEMMKRYPGKLKIVYKSFPLNMHQYAWKAATAAMAAHEKGKFWEFYKLLFKNYNQLNDEKIKEIQKTFGLDTTEFETVMNSDKVRNRVLEDRTEGIRIGVQGTPTVFINGKHLKNKRPDGFIEAIEKELSK